MNLMATCGNAKRSAGFVCAESEKNGIPRHQHAAEVADTSVVTDAERPDVVGISPPDLQT